MLLAIRVTVYVIFLLANDKFIPDLSIHEGIKKPATIYAAGFLCNIFISSFHQFGVAALLLPFLIVDPFRLQLPLDRWQL